MNELSWPFVGVIGLISLAGFVLWIWTLVDAVRVPDDSQFQSGTKLLWVLIIVLTGFIGSLIYLIVGRPQGGAPKAIADRQVRADGPTPDVGQIPPPPPPPPA